MIDLPAGPAMRRFSWQQAEPAETGNTMPVAHLDIEVAVSGTGAHLLMSFSTPMAPLAGPLTDLSSRSPRRCGGCADDCRDLPALAAGRGS